MTKRISTSSSKTEPSPASIEPENRLAQQILQELGVDEHSNDVMTKWMVHRIAELMQQAERSTSGPKRRAAQEQCEAAILRLWERRSSWPHGWPPQAPLDALRLLATEVSKKEFFQYPRVEKLTTKPSDMTGLQFLDAIAANKDAETFACMQVAYATADIEGAREWLDAADSNLTDAEREVLSKNIRTFELSRESLVKRNFDPRNENSASGEIDIEPVLREIEECLSIRLAFVNTMREHHVNTPAAKKAPRSAKSADKRRSK